MPVLPLRIKTAEANRLGLLAVAADYGVNADPQHFAPFHFETAQGRTTIWLGGYLVGRMRAVWEDGVSCVCCDVRDDVPEEAWPALTRAIRNAVRITSEVARYKRQDRTEKDRDYSERVAGSSHTIDGFSRADLNAAVLGLAGHRPEDLRVAFSRQGDVQGLITFGKAPTHTGFQPRPHGRWAVWSFRRGLQRVIRADVLPGLLEQGAETFRKHGTPLDLTVNAPDGLDAESVVQAIRNLPAEWTRAEMSVPGCVAEHEPSGHIRVVHNGAIIAWWPAGDAVHAAGHIRSRVNASREAAGLLPLPLELASALPLLAVSALSGRHPDDFVALSEDEMKAKVAAVNLGYDLSVSPTNP